MRAGYETFVEQGLDKKLFSLREIKDADEFLQIMQQKTNVVCFAVHDGKFAGVAWLNDIFIDHAFVHFAFAKGVWGPIAEDIGKQIIDYWFSFPNQLEGGLLFHVLVGKTPINNRPALSYAKRMGFTIVGEVPYVQRTGVTISYKVNPRWERNPPTQTLQ